MKLFSKYFEKLLLEQPDYFENGLIKGAYLIGAYSKSIIALLPQKFLKKIRRLKIGFQIKK